jgi:hypothetical protein
MNPPRRERQGDNVPSESELLRRQQYVKVLREVTAGDTLGPPQDHDKGETIRKFELSGKHFPVALIDQMIAENLLDADEERGVIVAAEGKRFFNQHR